MAPYCSSRNPLAFRSGFHLVYAGAIRTFPLCAILGYSVGTRLACSSIGLRREWLHHLTGVWKLQNILHVEGASCVPVRQRLNHERVWSSGFNHPRSSRQDARPMAGRTLRGIVLTVRPQGSLMLARGGRNSFEST